MSEAGMGRMVGLMRMLPLWAVLLGLPALAAAPPPPVPPPLPLTVKLLCQ